MDKAITIDPKEIEMEKDANGNDVLLGVGTYGRVGSLLVLHLHSHLVLAATESLYSDILQGHKGGGLCLVAGCLSSSHSTKCCGAAFTHKGSFLTPQQVLM